MKAVLPGLVLLLATACQSTSFQTPPVAADAGCDPALVGRWHSISSSGVDDGEVLLVIARDCQLQVTDRHEGQQRTGEPTQLRVARTPTGNLAWVGADWANARFEASDLDTPATDIYLFRYRVEGNDLRVGGVDHTYVAHAIIDSRIPGTVHSDDHALVNRVTGRARPELLALPELFGGDPLRLRREGAAP